MSIREGIINKFFNRLGVDFTHEVTLSLTVEELDLLIDGRYEDIEYSTEGTPRFNRIMNEIHQLGQLRFYKGLALRDRLDYLLSES